MGGAGLGGNLPDPQRFLGPVRTTASWNGTVSWTGPFPENTYSVTPGPVPRFQRLPPPLWKHSLGPIAYELTLRGLGAQRGCQRQRWPWTVLITSGQTHRLGSLAESSPHPCPSKGHRLLRPSEHGGLHFLSPVDGTPGQGRCPPSPKHPGPALLSRTIWTWMPLGNEFRQAYDWGGSTLLAYEDGGFTGSLRGRGRQHSTSENVLSLEYEMDGPRSLGGRPGQQPRPP
jgi:hypothetical protein